MIIPLLWRSAENSQGVQILILVLILINAILQDWIFLKYLPYYRINVLILSSTLQAIETSLALASFIVKLVEVGSASIGVFTFQIVWLLTVPILAKLYYAFTWRLLDYIFGCEIKNEKNIYYLIHKRPILLYLLKSRKIIRDGVNRLSFADLMYQAKLAIIGVGSDLPPAKLDRDKILLVRSLKIICLEILKRHPKNQLALINLAHSHSKFEDLDIVSNNLLEDAISKDPGYHEQISLNMIRLELQKRLMIQSSQKTEEEGLNVCHYVVSQELYKEMKDCIEKQTKLQLNFWKEFLSRHPKMLNLMKIALEVNNQRISIRKQWNNLLKIRSKSFLSPLIVYGMYSSLINNNPIEGENSLKQSQEDVQKLRKSFHVNELNNQTIFSDKTVQIIMSGLRSKLGRIVGCSSNISNFYGWQASEMKDKPIAFLMPPFYRQRHDSYLLEHFNTGKTKTLNTTEIVPVKRSNGYIHPTWLHTKVSPVMKNGIFYVGLLRPCKSRQRMVLVRKDGKIDDMSLGFARDMNLSGKESQIECDIFTLCPEFRQINEAFNIIADQTIEKIDPSSSLPAQSTDKNFQETEGNLMTLSERFVTENTDRPFLKTRRNHAGNQKSDFTQRESQQIYDTFIAGSTIKFYPKKISQITEPITYSVKVINNIHGNEVLKYVLLEKVSEGREASADEKTMTESSDHEAFFPSLKIFDRRITNQKKRTIILDGPSSLKVHSPTSPSIWETEGAELIHFSTSPRSRLTEHVHNDESDESIGDEYQQTESVVTKKTIGFTSIAEDLNHSISLRKENHSGVQTIEKRTDKNIQQLTKRKSKPKLKGVNYIEYSVSSSYLSKGRKLEQMMIQALKADPNKKSVNIFKALFIVFLISGIVLLALQSANLRSGIQQVQAQVPVISTAFFRQYNMVSSATQARLWKGVLEGAFSTGDWLSDNFMWRFNLEYYIIFMKQYNTRFYELLSELPLDLQSRFYEKNVGIYEYDDDGNKTLVNMGSSFETFQMMMEREINCLYTDVPENFTYGIDTSTFKFVVDNILNDLLVQSQSQIDQLSDYLHDSTNSTTLMTGFLMIGVFLACLISILICVRYLFLIASEARIFMTMIFRMKSEDCEIIQINLQHFQAWLNTDNLKERDIPIQEKIKMQENNFSSTRFRGASMGSLYNTQRIAFLKLLPIYCLFICWSLVYFFLTSNFIGDIQDSEKRMEAALQALNNQTLYNNEFICLFLSNNTATIKNEPLIPNIFEGFEYLKQVDAFVDNFRDRKGELTPLQQKVLFNFPCKDFEPYVAENYDAYYYAYQSCFVNGRGTNSIGLVNINTEFYDIGQYFLELYNNSSKSTEELAGILLLAIQTSYDLSVSAEGFLKLLYEATHESFLDDVDSIKSTALAFSVWIVVVTFIAGILMWYFVIKRIFRLQKIDWFILQLFPIKLIRSNKHLQQYLLKHSDGMLNRAKSY